jgi:hypothetical protein
LQKINGVVEAELCSGLRGDEGMSTKPELDSECSTNCETAFKSAYETIPKWQQIAINLFAREKKWLYQSWFKAGWDARGADSTKEGERER